MKKKMNSEFKHRVLFSKTYQKVVHKFVSQKQANSEINWLRHPYWLSPAWLAPLVCTLPVGFLPS